MKNNNNCLIDWKMYNIHIKNRFGGNNRNRNKIINNYPNFSRSSLFDISNNNVGGYSYGGNIATFQYFLTKRANQRRGSVPQDIFIRSLNNYTA